MLDTEDKKGCGARTGWGGVPSKWRGGVGTDGLLGGTARCDWSLNKGIGFFLTLLRHARAASLFDLRQQ